MWFPFKTIICKGAGKIKKDYVKAFQCYNITCEQEPTDGDPSGTMRIANGCAMKTIMLNDGSIFCKYCHFITNKVL